MSHTQSDESPDENSVFPFIITTLTDDRGQTQFCKNLLGIYLNEESDHAKQNFQK